MGLLLARADAEAQQDFSHARVLLDAEPIGCFLCGGALGGVEDVGYPIIFWRGYGTTIHWHASCAADFTFRIGQDVQRLKHELSMHLAFEPDGVGPAVRPQ